MSLIRTKNKKKYQRKDRLAPSKSRQTSTGDKQTSYTRTDSILFTIHSRKYFQLHSRTCWLHTSCSTIFVLVKICLTRPENLPYCRIAQCGHTLVKTAFKGSCRLDRYRVGHTNSRIVEGESIEIYFHHILT